MRNAHLAIAAVLLAVGCQGAPPELAPRRVPIPGEVGDSLTADALTPGTGAAQVEELLTGRFAGVRVVRMPNGGISVRIRGTTSVLGGNEPLYVVDGMIIEPGPGGALMGINPNDISSIKVLKDIGSTAFYGVRGANGVVVITLKH